MTTELLVPILRIPFDEDDAAAISQELSKMLLTGQLAMGPVAARFEEMFKDFVGAGHAVGCGSGTAALELIFRALDLPPGPVAVPSNTFLATALAPMASGHKPYFVDCDPDYFQMCPGDLARRLIPGTRAVVLTHIGGMISPSWRRIKEIAESAGAVLIEDAAHAHGASHEGDMAGTLGRAAAFSFFPTKVLTTAEGGMATTSDGALAERMRAIRQHGQMRPGSNVHEMFGLNYRPSEIHALLGIRMMAKAEWILGQRRAAAAVYDRLLAQGAGGFRPALAPAGQKPSYYKYMGLLPEGVDRGELKREARERFGIAMAGEVYSTPAHRQPIWAARPEYLAAPPGELPVSDMVARRQACLPIWPGLRPEDQELVADALAKVLGKLLGGSKRPS